MAPAIAAVTALLSVRAGTGNATRVSPAPAQRCPVDRQVLEQQQASVRPGGCEAPAVGGAGAGRGLWPPAGPDPGAALRQGRWPLPLKRGQRFRQCGRDQETQRVSSARAGRCPVDRQVQDQRQASARPGGGEAPARGGAGAGRGLWSPADPCHAQHRTGAMTPARLQGAIEKGSSFPAGSPCSWHFFSGLLRSGS